MKFILFSPLIFLLMFAGCLCAYEADNPNIEIQMLSDSPDFDVINDITENYADETEAEHFNIGEPEKIYYMIAMQPEGFSVLKFPGLRAEPIGVSYHAPCPCSKVRSRRNVSRETSFYPGSFGPLKGLYVSGTSKTHFT